ncbi:hypothetical protein SPFM12_00261 [Salmonella phage SPFM12]|nr:hypothetical protein SPFM12_00261 [Salmonella phage SPFM12]
MEQAEVLLAEALANNSSIEIFSTYNAKVKFVKQALNTELSLIDQRANMLAMDIQGTMLNDSSKTWKEVKDQFHVDHKELFGKLIVEADAKAVPVFDFTLKALDEAQAAFLGMCQQGGKIDREREVTEAIAHEELKAMMQSVLKKQAVFIESTEFLSRRKKKPAYNPRKDARDFVKAFGCILCIHPTPNCKRIITMSLYSEKWHDWVTVPHDAS